MSKFKVGDQVIVLGPGADETFPRQYRGKEGVVRELITADCGASKQDPLYRVAFPHQRSDGFWGEELSHVTEGGKAA